MPVNLVVHSAKYVAKSADQCAGVFCVPVVLFHMLICLCTCMLVI